MGRKSLSDYLKDDASPLLPDGYWRFRPPAERLQLFRRLRAAVEDALSQLSPGPLAAQLAMYLGWVRGGRLGATLVAGAFILPSFVMVLMISWLKRRRKPSCA